MFWSVKVVSGNLQAFHSHGYQCLFNVLEILTSSYDFLKSLAVTLGFFFNLIDNSVVCPFCLDSSLRSLLRALFLLMSTLEDASCECKLKIFYFFSSSNPYLQSCFINWMPGLLISNSFPD